MGAQWATRGHYSPVHILKHFKKIKSQILETNVTLVARPERSRRAFSARKIILI